MSKNCDELTEEMLKARREYKRRWREANKDKVKRYNANFWAKQAARQQAEAANTETGGANGTDD